MVLYNDKHLHCSAEITFSMKQISENNPFFFLLFNFRAILTPSIMPTSSSASPPSISPSFCWHAWGIDRVLIAQSSCHSCPSIHAMSHHRAGVCHCLRGSRGFVPEVTDSCREGGARQTRAARPRAHLSLMLLVDW